MREVILYSGGMDSLILAAMRPSAMKLYVSLGTRYTMKERVRLPTDVVIDRRLFLGDRERADAIVPDRNLFLAAIAAMYGDRIMLGATAGDLSHDKDEYWAHSVTDLLNYMRSDSHSDGWRVSVILPIKHLSKGELVDWYLANQEQNPVQVLLDSVSCYSANLGQCGICKSCMRKWIALESRGIECSRIFVQSPVEADWSTVRIALQCGTRWRCAAEDEDAKQVLSHYKLI